MGYNLPAPSDFKSQFPRDFPYAVPGNGAAAHATLVGGVGPAGIAAIVLDAGGELFSVPPLFTISDPTGAGAILGPATVAKGVITAAPAVTNPGANYTAPQVAISLGGGDPTRLSYVTDNDLAAAITDSQFNFNEDLFSTQAMFTRAMLFLAAHMLVENIRMATEGLASQYAWITAAKAVGDVSESYQVPEYLMKDPWLASISKTRYGVKYIQIIAPLLVGHTMVLGRFSLP